MNNPNHNTTASVPMIESMESRVLFAGDFVGGIYVATGDVNNDGAEVVSRKAGGEQQEYLRYELKNVQITSYQL